MSDTVLLTIPEVAEQLRVSPRTVKREIQRRHLRPVKIGASTRISARELEAYVAHLEGPKRRVA